MDLNFPEMPLPQTPHLESPKWNILEVTRVGSVSRVTQNKSRNPLKILDLKPVQGVAHVVLSNYGGGLVQGDSVFLRILCRKGSSAFLTSQSYNKVFKNPSRKETKQTLHGILESGASLIAFPDPLVLQKDSLFVQKQHWELGTESHLLLLDWVFMGRTALKENFLFESYDSEIRFTQTNKTLMLDRFSFSPRVHSPTSPAYFGPFLMMLNVYAFGTAFQTLLPDLFEKEILKHQACPSALIPIGSVGSCLRALGKRRSDFDPWLKVLFSHLKKSPFLGFNPLERKH